MNASALIKVCRRFLTIGALCLLLKSKVASAQGVACGTNTSLCEELLWTGSECRNGYCSNPFEKGCLYGLLNHTGDPDNDKPELSWLKDVSSTKYGFQRTPRMTSILRLTGQRLRMCNSEDSTEVRGKVCTDYSQDPRYEVLLQHSQEIRIHSLNWESAFFSAWILQIVLSEILMVPTSIETGAPGVTNSFYDSQNTLGYGVMNEYETLQNAMQVNGECTLYSNTSSASGSHTLKQGYKPCAHVVPEHWAHGETGGPEGLDDMEARKMIDAPQELGVIGNNGLYVTRFTAEEDPSILTYLGLMGEQNRAKLARLFKRPTRWEDYCAFVSKNNCATPDDVAKRAPLANSSDNEGSRFHVEGLYIGHFRATDKNDCELNPTTCNGHVGEYPCDWASLLQPWIYHLNLSLSSDGRGPKFGYTYQELSDMWDAAQATRSHLMTLWWTPEAKHAQYVGSDVEMVRVSLPATSQECLDNRATDVSMYACNNETNNNDLRLWYGDPRGSCDYFYFPLFKLLSQSLRIMSMTGNSKGELPEALQSPAYEAISGYEISNLEIGTILKSWVDRGVDKYGFDPRLATCLWVRDHFEDLMLRTVPESYPRVVYERKVQGTWLYTLSLTLGCMATLLASGTAFLVYQKRATPVMKWAQVDFLIPVLCGLWMISMAAIFAALEPSDETCQLTKWLAHIGYTLELVPLIVKETAINKLLQSAKKMRRVKINRSKLYQLVFAWTVLSVIYMIVWTVVDPRNHGQVITLTGEANDQGETVVVVENLCCSQSEIWKYIAIVFQFLLLMWAAVIAFQTRSIPQKFSESKTLAAMIYAQFFFVIFRIILLAIIKTTIPAYQVGGVWSIVFSLDAIVTICIYFVPKLLVKNDLPGASTHMSGLNRDSFGSPVLWPPTNTKTTTANSAADDQSACSMASSAPSISMISDTASRLSRSLGLVRKSDSAARESARIASSLIHTLQSEVTSLKARNEDLENKLSALLKSEPCHPIDKEIEATSMLPLTLNQIPPVCMASMEEEEDGLEGDQEHCCPFGEEKRQLPPLIVMDEHPTPSSLRTEEEGGGGGK